MGSDTAAPGHTLVADGSPSAKSRALRDAGAAASANKLDLREVDLLKCHKHLVMSAS
jgi:hypothetical protein